ncbi:Uncharacterised protein [Bifidobacterium longum subsp. infantis]|uniref:Uncharacterized protein n=1 Tax=Bifidobacterium longum subsp. infantis TaxID=1682 RepID=A0A564VF41_BIFLI|nr:Uncharacterised protein [Bifidobacterium longum subsp. infantis]
MLLAANGPWNYSKGHLLFAGGAQCAKYLLRCARTPPDGTSAMRQTSHHAVSPLAFADYPPWGGNFLMGR